MSKEQLAAILEKGDSKECVAFFANLSEKERQSYSQQALSWFKPVKANYIVEVKPGTFTQNQLAPAAEVALLATCSLSQLQKLGTRALPPQELAFDVLASRRPDWLDNWSAWLCDQVPH